MQNSFLIRAGTFIARVSQTSENAHAIRLRSAILAKKAIDAFIAEEVRRAQKHSPKSEAYMSWSEIGQALELSRSAAYTRYGGKDDKQ